MADKHGVTTEKVYAYFHDNPGASLEEAAKTLRLPSRANVRFHILKLAKMGLVELPEGKHRQIKTIGGQNGAGE